MKKPYTFVLYFTVIVFGYSCGKCEKLNLSDDEKRWIFHYEVGQQFIFTSSKSLIDTLTVRGIISKYTPCNKIELSRYQYEIQSVLFVMKSKLKYNLDEPSITMTTQDWKQRIPYIYFGNLGPHRNDLENKMPVAIDTVLNGVKLKSVYYYAKGLNTEQYGATEYFMNFFWDKQSGLVAYTTLNDELFLRIDQLVMR